MCVCACGNLDSKLKVWSPVFVKRAGGAGADLPFLSNEATANQWKYLGMLKCVPAKTTARNHPQSCWFAMAERSD